MSANRIYLVVDKGSEKPLLIRATSPAQALRYIAEDVYVVNVATQDQLLDALGKGAIVEDATAMATTE